ncbi:MAG TPA: hypothetical protein VFH03_27805 [Actinoplanes sp.]|nr:hypothetical protein [Actinoplanes sp.]
MNEFAVLAAVTALVMLFVLAEIAAAVLPLIIVLTLVAPEQRQSLADVLAACDSSRKLRIWTALRVAVKARRARRNRTVSSDRDREAAFNRARDAEVNAPRPYHPEADRPPVSGRSSGAPR